MDYTVSGGVIAALVAELLLMFVLPIALLIRWHKRSGQGMLAPVVGMIVFLVFAQLLEQLLHYACLISSNPISRAIHSHPLLYALYGGLAAGLFEETGRFVGFSHLLKRSRNRQTAIGYGLGHGGYECVAVVGMAAVSYLLLALIMNSGLMPTVMEAFRAEEIAIIDQVLAQIAALTPAMCVWAIVERLIAMALHVSLSVLVFASVWQPEHGRYYLLAICLHAAANLPAGCYQAGLLAGSGGLIMAELLTLVITIGIACFAKRVWDTLPPESSDSPNSSTV